MYRMSDDKLNETCIDTQIKSLADICKETC